MHVKIFNDSLDSGKAIQKVIAVARISYGASLQLFYQPEYKDAILRSLRDAEVAVDSSARFSLTIKADRLF